MATTLQGSPAAVRLSSAAVGNSKDRCRAHNSEYFSYQALPRAVERIQEAEERVTAQAAICDETYEEIMAALNTLADLCDRDILFRKYIKFQSWSEIMQGTNLSRSAVLAHHRQAIESLQVKGQD